MEAVPESVSWTVDIGFDELGDAVVALQFEGDPKPRILPAGAVDRLNVTLSSAVAAARVRASMYRNLSLLGWSREDALAFVNKHCGSALE